MGSMMFSQSRMEIALLVLGRVLRLQEIEIVLCAEIHRSTLRPELRPH